MKPLFEQIAARTGKTIQSIRLSPQDFEAFKALYQDDRVGIDNQKLLEYYISYKFLGFEKSDVYIDIAAQNCPFAFFIRDQFGCTAYRQDLYYLKRGLHGNEIGGDASRLPLWDESASKISLHNSLEHFEGDSDIEFIQEAQRVLRLGGKMIVVPLFMSETYEIEAEASWVDSDGRRHLWNEGASFSRLYDAERLQTRLLQNAPCFDAQFYFIENIAEMGQECYGDFFVIFEKVRPVPNRNGLQKLASFVRAQIPVRPANAEKSLAQRFREVLLWRGQLMVNSLREKMAYAETAQNLAQRLVADTAWLDETSVSQTRQHLLSLCAQRGYDLPTQQMWLAHTHRLMLTEKWITESLRGFEGPVQALDLGVRDVASDYWQIKFPNVAWQNTDFNLRYPWKIAPGSFDLILCTELVEHLSDQHNEQSFNEGFYKLGFLALLRESFKALKPGGILLLTTPNAASLVHLRAVLNGTPPWFFIKHVREYTLPEIIELANRVGFTIIKKRAIHCMTDMNPSEYAFLFKILLENGYPVEDRGDDLFVMARKPE
jgi:SAM-dependent methyltransferase